MDFRLTDEQALIQESAIRFGKKWGPRMEEIDVGYASSDLDALADRAIVQKRLVDNAPCAVDRDRMRALFESALDYGTP